MHARKPIGRVRVIAVLAALGVSVLAGAVPASAAGGGSDLPQGLADRASIEVDDDLPRGWDWTPGGDGVSTLGWNWAR